MKLDMMVQDCNPNIHEAEARRFLWIQGQPGPGSEFKSSLSQIVSIKKQNKTKQTQLSPSKTKTLVQAELSIPDSQK